MSEVTFDTHAEIRKLERAGCPKTQAEAMVDLVSRAPLNIRTAKALERLSFQVETNMATKADIADLRADIFRALWIQGASLAALIVALAGLSLR
ncbi:MAG: hypothetical protein OXQ86_06330 [Gammaproteobacteria bacterium]|nr:hypothetical protein [Gammaproteobacteria bacterium]MDE0414610.1 hypothetical protein [Gammaproteobacteria bacterium]